MSKYISAIITVLVGLVAYWVYVRQKKDYKRDAANIVLIEIENAERQLSIILGESSRPEQTLPANILTVPNNSWDKYKYLFVKNFDQNEWDKITEFYSRCERYDNAVRYNGSFFSEDVVELRKNAHAVIATIAKDMAYNLTDAPDESESDKDKKVVQKYTEIRKRFETIYATNPYLYSPQKPINDATEALKSLETSLSLTSVGTKLKKLSRGGFFTRVRNAILS